MVDARSGSSLCGRPWRLPFQWLRRISSPGNLPEIGLPFAYTNQERGPHPRPCVCGKPYDLHDQLVSGLSGPSVNETAASLSRNPPSAAFANVPNGRWNPTASAVNAANRNRMNAAVRHRPARTQKKMSQATPEPATVSELFFAVWPFTVSYLESPLYRIPLNGLSWIQNVRILDIPRPKLFSPFGIFLKWLNT